MLSIGRKKRIGLVLSSGAARGLAHIGVLKALVENRVPIDRIVGSSIGALVGAYFARYGQIADLEGLVLRLNFKDLLTLADPNIALLMRGFISGKRVEKFLKILIGDVEFKDLQIPLEVVTTDIYTGERVVITQGKVIDAVCASIAIPAIFTPVKYQDRFLVDGGVADPVPVDVLRKSGINCLIVSNVIQPPKKRTREQFGKQELLSAAASEPLKQLTKIEELIAGEKKAFDKMYSVLYRFKENMSNRTIKKHEEFPNIFEVILQMLYIMEYQMAQEQSKAADIVIQPRVDFIELLEFYRGPELVDQGYKKAKSVIIRNKKQLGI